MKTHSFMENLKSNQKTISTESLSNSPSPVCIEATSRIEKLHDVSLIQPASPRKDKHRHRKPKAVRVVKSIFRSMPIIALRHGSSDASFKGSGGNRVTGTLFGPKKGKMSFSLQQTTNCLPTLVMELPIQTDVFQKEMALGMDRITLECEKVAQRNKTKLLDESIWTMFCNGKNFGYGLKREANEKDLGIMELLKVTTMGIGVVPRGKFCDNSGNSEDEIVYIRAHFEHVVGSKDNETLYMICPECNSVPELSIFFLRI